MLCLSYFTVFIVMCALRTRLSQSWLFFDCTVVYSLFTCAHVIFLRFLLQMFLLYVGSHVCPSWMLFVQFYTEYCEHPLQTKTDTLFKSKHPYNLNPAICS